LPENPLLPHRKLKELHALMLRCRELEQKQRPRYSREALLAATAIHLSPGDLLITAANDPAAQLAPTQPRAKKSVPPPQTAPAANLPRITLAAAAAQGLKAANTESIVLAYTPPGAAEPNWPEALTWAHANSFPLILACAATYAPQPRASKSSALAWDAVSKLGARLQLPVVPVDGEDAVAIYRVMQESILRARTGGGPAILWAMLNPAPLPRSQRPTARLEAYLKARNIKTPPLTPPA
jgi:hypothetical protein